LKSSRFDEWEKKDFHGVPRSPLVEAYDVRGYLAEAEEGDYYLVFDNGEGRAKVYVNYLVEARWATTATKQVK